MTYKNVYFRVETPAYRFHTGWNQEQANEFDQECVGLFVSDGWEVKERRYSGSCTTVTKGKQHLYLHPQEFSGEVLEESIKHIEQLLQNTKTFKYYNTDIYETRHDLTNEEYKKLFDKQENNITADILEAFKTKRSNLYFTNSYSVLKSVMSKYSVIRLGYGYQDEFPSSYAGKILSKLIDQGYIITANAKNGKGYRTLNKTEQKHLKICFA